MKQGRDQMAGNWCHSRIVLIAIAAILIWVFLLHSHSLVRRLNESSIRSNETIAWFWAGTQVPFSIVAENATIGVCSECGHAERLSPSASDSIPRYCPQCRAMTSWFNVNRWSEQERNQVVRATRGLFRTLVDRLEYPTVFSDAHMMPQVVNGEVVPDEVDPALLREYLILMERLDCDNDPIPIIENADTIGFLHYGSSSIFRELTLVPYLELGILLFLALIFFLGIRSELKREKETSWVSFAKETAHQISTPLSSLMGWIELLRDRPETNTDQELAEALDSIEADVGRLSQIARRYGQMGKKPVLTILHVNDIIEETIAYFRRRPGILHDGIEISTELSAEKLICGNHVLLGWVFENLLKNSLASLTDREDGRIVIISSDLEEANGMVEVIIRDNGRGIPFRDQTRIFKPGFTTRRGGWGLGLTLTRRIVEEYHGGRVRLVSSAPGKGTTFSIIFPAKEKDD